MVAFTGHYGSFLLDDADRPLVLSMVERLARQLSIPVFVKIRLLSTLEQTVEFCRELGQAGAALIAVHARHRVNLIDRKANARGGPALLDQVTHIRQALHDADDSSGGGAPEGAGAGSRVPPLLIANGNVITHEDIARNLASTGADGIMSACGHTPPTPNHSTPLPHPPSFSPDVRACMAAGSLSP
eukprot:COSAG05_NODE_638_length_8163_cov_16.318452_4_plen_186_part_00